jgi:hypothetical protein
MKILLFIRFMMGVISCIIAFPFILILFIIDCVIDFENWYMHYDMYTDILYTLLMNEMHFFK